MGFKLVHQSGYVSCDTNSVRHWSFWGCGEHPSLKKHVDPVITTRSNQILLPLSPFFTHRVHGRGKWSELPGYNSRSKEIVLPFFSPYSVRSGQQFRLWYGEDLAGYTEGDNGGNVCCDVYALYI